MAEDLWSTRAGMEILEQGGNAADAAVATAFALAVVDPVSAGLGGGGFMVIYQTKEKKAHVLDFREIAPGLANAAHYVRGGRLNPRAMRNGALAVGVPGVVAGLLEALKRFGSLPLETVLAPAIRYAEEGFPMTARLGRVLEQNMPALRKLPNLGRIFLKPDGTPYALGEKVRQPELAASLKAIAREGAAVFYQGRIGQAIVAELQKTLGVLTLEDLKSYKPVWRRPIISHYRDNVVITVPPPSGGGAGLIQMLNVLEGYSLIQFPHNSAAYFHVLAEIMKVVYAQQAAYLGDPDFTEIPLQRLTSKKEAASVRSLISPDETRNRGLAGPRLSDGRFDGSAYFGVLDGEGTAIGMSLSLNDPLGAKILVRETGIILNNAIADFFLAGGPEGSGNRLEPGKRPLSSMTPVIVLEGDKPVLLLGASGGSEIPSAVLQTILNVLDFKMPLKQALREARVHADWRPNQLLIEAGVPEQIKKALEERGQNLETAQGIGAVQAIQINDSEILGQPDPRIAED